MWTPLRTEIEGLRKSLGFTESDFCAVSINEWQQMEDNIYKTFCRSSYYKTRPNWLWENFKQEAIFANLLNQAHTYLDQLIPEHETVWLLVNETVNEQSKFWLYEGKVKAIQQVIAESSYLDELYITSKKYSWMVGINHHKNIFATGDQMVAKLNRLKNSHSH